MKEFLRRAGWFSLAMLLLCTGVVLTVVILWMQTHQSSTPDQSQTAAKNCTFSGSVSSPVLSAPQIYKPPNNPSKLEATNLSVGSGKPAIAGDCVVAKYYGTLTNGTLFDQDYTTPNALQFSLGQGEVIPGWDQGLIGMQAGGERRLVIPPSLAYGSQGQGSIPPNSTLVFVVKLISIK